MSSPPARLAEKSKSKKKHKEKEKKGKSKEKALAQVIGEGHGRNEGVDPNWAYQPPEGMVMLDTSEVDEDFDWDSLRDDDGKELWIVRIPEGFKTKLLDGLEIQPPIKSPGAKLATLERKRAKYNVWSAEQPSNDEQSTKGDDERSPRGEEINTLSCLLPRKKKHGKFYLAPKPISQHIIVTYSPAIPNVDNGATPTPSARYSVPKNLLRHRFLPVGASSTDGIRHPTDAMDVDALNQPGGQVEADVETESPSRTKKHNQSGEPPGGRKRKNAEGQNETPKHKAKKVKI